MGIESWKYAKRVYFRRKEGKTLVDSEKFPELTSRESSEA
jgi:hypothetical protein